MKIIDRFKKVRRELTLFDYLIIVIFVAGIIFFAFIFFRKPVFTNVTVKVSEDTVIWPKPGSEDWYARLFYTGMSEKDGLGKTQAEVTEVFSFDTSPSKKVVYLTVKLRSVYTKSTNQYSFKGKPILVGYPIKLQLDNVNVDGLITQTEGTKNRGERVALVIEARTWVDNLANFPDTTGIRPYIAEAIKVGDSVRDNKGEPLITVSNKTVSDGRKIVTNSSGDIFIRNNPLLKDVALVLRVNATRVNNEYYLFDDLPLYIGGPIPINLSYVSIFPDITKITPVED